MSANRKIVISKGGFMSEDIEEILHCHHKYSRSLSSAENLNFLPKTVNNLFKFSFRSTCRLFQISYEGDFWSLCTVTFSQKVDFLISNAH